MENANQSSPPESLTSPISRRVRELNKLLESLDIVVPPPTSELSCLEREAGFELVIEEEERRVRGLSVFVGNFTYACDFVNLKDVSSVIDAHLGQMVLGKPFVKESKLVYDQEEGTMLFEKNGGKVTYKMPHKMDRWKDEDYMNLIIYHLFYVASKEDKQKRDDYIYQKGELNIQIA
ncbi:hypothetical protein Tco_0344569 [Tanacetum coccineum]